MLSKVKDLKGFKLKSLDGEIGEVNEFYFDDHYWILRYLVADTGNWLTGRQVLIAPYALIGIDKINKNVSIDLSKNQIEHSPILSFQTPVSKQFEEQYYNYYGWPVYWGGASAWGYAEFLSRDSEAWVKENQIKKSWDPHLRSTNAVTGYHLHAIDGEIGHVEDFIIDDDTWEIRYLIVSTQNWWPGKLVLIDPKWISRVSWAESMVYINLTRQAIQISPAYTALSLLTRDYESLLYKHYNSQAYWDK